MILQDLGIHKCKDDGVRIVTRVIYVEPCIYISHFYDI